MSNRQALKHAARAVEARTGRRQRSPGVSRSTRGTHAQVPGIGEFQRSRLLTAAVQETSERGYEATPVAAIIARACVSRKTFYDIFDNREHCFLAVFEESVAQAASVVVPAYEGEDDWSERLRAALVALLAFLESEPNVGAFALAHMVGGRPSSRACRSRVLAVLERTVDEGRLHARPGSTPSPLTAELIVGGALAVIHRRAQNSPQHLITLVNPLMWMIVLPYVGPAAAAAELRRATPEADVAAAQPERDPLKDLDMRLTYRTTRVLAVIAEEPGLSNSEISTLVDVVDQGQISKLLSRLARLGLLENNGPGQPMGAANAWCLTRKGEEVDSAIRHGFASRARPGRRR